VSIRTKKLTNRGFMTGPVLPIYGFGAITMVWVGMPLMGQPVAMFFAGLVCASTLEFFTGDVMQRLFKVRYWDYSDCFLNIKGHICFKASLAWGVFTLLMNYFAHKPIERMVLQIPENVLHPLVFVLVMVFVADYSLAFKTAMELRNVIISLEAFREELERMERRMDVAIAFAEDSRHQAKEALIAKVEDSTKQAQEAIMSKVGDGTKQAKLMLSERMEALEARFEEAREKLTALELEEEKKRQDFLEQIAEYRVNNAVMRKRLEESAKRRGALYRHMIRNNPLSSDKCKEALAEIKAKVEEYKK